MNPHHVGPPFSLLAFDNKKYTYRSVTIAVLHQAALEFAPTAVDLARRLLDLKPYDVLKALSLAEKELRGRLSTRDWYRIAFNVYDARLTQIPEYTQLFLTWTVQPSATGDSLNRPISMEKSSWLWTEEPNTNLIGEVLMDLRAQLQGRPRSPPPTHSTTHHITSLGQVKFGTYVATVVTTADGY